MNESTTTEGQAAPPTEPVLEQWCIAELFGHKRIAGRITEVMVAGVGWLRIEIPNSDGPGWKACDLVSPKAFYRIRGCTEEQARAAARALGDTPVVHDYEMRALPASSGSGTRYDQDDEDRHGDDDRDPGF